ncbi:glycosyltransferase family 2 protein [Flavobacteriaceae bacterium 14752]|uniref:glycosyltransferase family 2 protein n=1 Tax=Mesohalobacter salilacus TaxID=2491711 RepID=UPI000F634AC3|nr:glycosyltransferase family 2 protein [Flavobacteriaceae bacterium 14752]
MIILVHNTDIVISCQKTGKVLSDYHQKPLVNTFFKLAKDYPDELLIWVHQDIHQNLNTESFDEIFHHKRIMASYSGVQYLPESIGYVEQSPFINVNLEVKYPTWRMHQNVGGINTAVVNKLEPFIKRHKNLNYILHSIAKLAQPRGLLCYSHPKLLKPVKKLQTVQNQKANTSELFSFVAQHYKWVWKHLLLLNLTIYESKFNLWAWLKSLFLSQIKVKSSLLKSITLPELKPFNKSQIQLDVIIPTIGRKKYLYDVLKDLSKQSLLPQNVIIIEQNPNPETQSELDYLVTEQWPFKITHRFIHQTGACNARNMALDLVKSEWVFLADDDIRIEKDYLLGSIELIKRLGSSILVTECLREFDVSQKFDFKSWPTFGSGTSILKFEVIKNIKFNMSYENGFGEDVDFGMQIRNLGYDVLFSSKTKLKHLKAPVGGFRTSPSLPWGNEKPLPKPSPTVLLSKILHHSEPQVYGYKTLLFINTLKSKGLIHLFSHLSYFKKAWNTSLRWSTILNNKHQ